MYESLWGNTAAIARAIAAGIGPDARALTTAEADAEAIAGADLVVAGAPVLGFTLPTDGMRDSIRVRPGAAPSPDLSNPSMRSWLDALGAGKGGSAAFETRIWWSPGGATSSIVKGLESAGFASVARPQRFIVTGRYGPLRDGEVERARAWGVELARAAG